MKLNRIFALTAFVLSLALTLAASGANSAPNAFSVYEPSQSDKLDIKDSQVEAQPDRTVVTALGKHYNWPGVTIHGNWDASRPQTSVYVTIKNMEDAPLTVCCRIDDVNSTKTQRWHSVSKQIKAKDKIVWEIPLPNQSLSPEIMDKLFAMRGGPGGVRINYDSGDRAASTPIDFTKMESVWLFVTQPAQPVRFAVFKIEVAPSTDAINQSEVNESASGKSWRSMTVDEFFPMIDVYGQFKHEDWPGKTHSDEELKGRVAQEQADWEANPRPGCWDKYGGWADGPKQDARGHFYTVKLNGKWWLVDPDGNLFWSHGVDCVGMGNATTPVTDREFYFEGLPAQDDPHFKQFYATAGWAPHNYYSTHCPFKTFNFTAANLYRKFGDGWYKQAGEEAHARLESWAMNTIANWSDKNIYLYSSRKTPYVATLHAGARQIEGSAGYWGKFTDPFDPKFADSFRRSLNNMKETIDDPYCIGYFVNNEMSWGDDTSLSLGALASPADQPAKIAFVTWLREKYKTVDALNSVWKTSYENWDALLESQAVPDKNLAGDDLRAFYTVISEKYFQTIHEIIQELAPNKLDLGCRFAWGNDLAIRASAKYCDVVSFNRYNRSIANFTLPEGVDKPCIIGEFHFGALDRGMFHTGLVPCKSQADRAQHYENYVRGALENPYWVGTHWFQYGSQATTGRGDGENYQIGLVDLADTPYKELIQAVRTVGRDMYKIRSGK